MLGERVAAATVVAGVSDVAWRGFFDEYGALWPDLVELMGCPDEASAQTWCDEHYGPDGARFGDSVPPLGAGDRAWFRTEHVMVASFRRSMAEALRQGWVGFAQDILLEARPWSFDPGNIATPVRVVHGETDIVLPVAHSRHTAIVRTASFEIVPGHGHLSILAEFPALRPISPPDSLDRLAT